MRRPCADREEKRGPTGRLSGQKQEQLDLNGPNIADRTAKSGIAFRRILVDCTVSGMITGVGYFAVVLAPRRVARAVGAVTSKSSASPLTSAGRRV